MGGDAESTAAERRLGHRREVVDHVGVRGAVVEVAHAFDERRVAHAEPEQEAPARPLVQRVLRCLRGHRVTGVDLGDTGRDAQRGGRVEEVGARHHGVATRRLGPPQARPAHRLDLARELAHTRRGVLVEERGPESDSADVDHACIVARTRQVASAQPVSRR